MVKHIVFWKLKETAHGKSRQENAVIIKKMLEDLSGKIPGLTKIEVGIDFSKEAEFSADVALYSEFESREALDGYQKHPLHEEVKHYIGEARSERRIVDYYI
ncbi:MAG: Dabb family protein [Cytophagaceae bacterium]